MAGRSPFPPVHPPPDMGKNTPTCRGVLALVDGELHATKHAQKSSTTLDAMVRRAGGIEGQIRQVKCCMFSRYVIN